MLEKILKMLDIDDEIFNQYQNKPVAKPKKQEYYIPKKEEPKVDRKPQVNNKQLPSDNTANNSYLFGDKITSNDLVNGIILSEIIAKPVSMRK